MAAGPHTFVSLDVFTSKRYHGSQLAIVSVRNNSLTREKKQQIAKEFGHPTTAFLHDAPPSSETRLLEFFSPDDEKIIAVDATLGAALYIFQKLSSGDLDTPARDNAALRKLTPENESLICLLQTKSGIMRVHYDAVRQVAAVEVPHSVHVHGRETTKDEIVAVQPGLPQSPDVSKMKASYSIVSLAQGVTFTLVDFTTTPDLMAAVQPGDAPEPDLDAGWDKSPRDGMTPSYCGAVYFLTLQSDFTEEPYLTRLQVRVVVGGIEENASPNACCAVAVFLALQKGGENSRHAYAIDQGIEQGRGSQLCVEVRLNDRGTSVSRIILSGRAMFVMEGTLL